jgi:hemolysin III
MEQQLPTPHDFGFTPQEELANTVIHAIGILFGLIAMPILISYALRHDAISNVMRVGIYGLCFMATFTFSTVYHWLKKEKMKLLFEKFDRISIYFFIAGTYTPFILYYMNNAQGMAMLGSIWGMVFLGLILEVCCVKKYVFISVLFYMLMGWMFIFVLKQFFQTMPFIVIALILAGVALYSIGVIFYVWQKWRYHHAIWHLFVLFASICHYVAVLKTVD